MIAEKIRDLRLARGWTQAELARRMGVTRNGINSWEQGLSMPSPASLVDLSKIFSVSTDYLLGVEALKTVNVSGLDDREVALLAELADRLRKKSDAAPENDLRRRESSKSGSPQNRKTRSPLR